LCAEKVHNQFVKVDSNRNIAEQFYNNTKQQLTFWP